MYIIMVYDVNEKRVAKILKVARKYLNWVQNSVLEGEISPGKFEKLKMEVKRLIDKNEDSVRFYITDSSKFFKLEKMGRDKSEIGIFY
ncbi:CRISPR-associated endonuclease Cas2 [Thermotoga sp. KOL6]|uniref:CRISPR-associated endonuclease Cas2 n=1 Tax=Thermotoga sp. KOL6 TaxID=126741 RepID=UPI000C75FEA2|nr:CRISPR-associated endonuclease Cas2 [Thermotoga sp. KOL6]PLV58069.1 CRISPR-associated protein Cas2 [Thermotoga sp. KOL6]